MEIEIEMRQANGGFYKAYVQSVFPDNLLVTFENDWQPSATLPYDQCRLTPIYLPPLLRPSPSPIYKEGEMIECLAKNLGNEGSGWHQARVKQIKGEFAVVDFVSPDVMGTGGTDVLSFDRCRPLTTSISLKHDSFKRDVIDVPEDLREYSKRPDAYIEFGKAVKNLFVQFDEATGKLNLTSCYGQSFKRAHILADIYFKETRQKMMLLQRQEEAQKQQEEAQKQLQEAQKQLQYLLKGYKMLNEYCSHCTTILMEDREGEKYCIACEEVDYRRDSDSEEFSHPVPQTTAVSTPLVAEMSLDDSAPLYTVSGAARNIRVALEKPVKNRQTSSSASSRQTKISKDPTVLTSSRCASSSSIEFAMNVVDAKLKWAAEKLSQTEHIGESKELVQLMKMCVDMIEQREITRV